MKMHASVKNRIQKLRCSVKRFPNTFRVLHYCIRVQGSSIIATISSFALLLVECAFVA